MTLRTTLRLAWSEHGTWAIFFISFGLGSLIAWPPGPATACTFGGLCALAAAKVLYLPARQKRASGLLVALLALLGIAGLAPLLFKATLPLSVLGLIAAPFAALFAFEADDPKWGRAIAVETAGVALLSASAALAVLSTHPTSVKDAGLAAGASSALFLPGVARARLLKGGSFYQRLALLGLAICGAAFLLALVRWRIIAPFGALAALAFAGDLRAVIWKPKTTTRHLGFLLTLRGALAAIILALAWRWLSY